MFKEMTAGDYMYLMLFLAIIGMVAYATYKDKKLAGKI